MLDVYKLIITVIMCYAVYFAFSNRWDKCYGWLGVDLTLVILGIFCFGM